MSSVYRRSRKWEYSWIGKSNTDLVDQRWGSVRKSSKPLLFRVKYACIGDTHCIGYNHCICYYNPCCHGLCWPLGCCHLCKNFILMMMLNTILRIIMNEVFGNNYEDTLINDVFSCECEDLGLGCCYFAAIQRRCLQNHFHLIMKTKKNHGNKPCYLIFGENQTNVNRMWMLN